MNDLTTTGPAGVAMTVQEIGLQRKVIIEIMQKAMVKDVHYGQIPGTNNNALLKAGSEMLLSAFHIAVEPEIEDLSTFDEIRYRVKCRGLSMGSGHLVGVGLGEASSLEEKYQWRRGNDREYESTAEDRKRIKYVPKQGNSGQFWENKQVRANMSDQANTILKMAKKRAQVDLTLTALACSDAFDDTPPARPPMHENPAPAQQRQPGPDLNDVPANTNGELNLGMVRATMDKSGLRDVDLWAHLGATTWGDIKGDDLAKAMTWIEENSP